VADHENLTAFDRVVIQTYSVNQLLYSSYSATLQDVRLPLVAADADQCSPRRLHGGELVTILK